MCILFKFENNKLYFNSYIVSNSGVVRNLFFFGGGGVTPNSEIIL
jgi:hypothetical protein